MMKDSNKNINITIVNAHWNNRGDEAALLAFLERLKKTYENSRVTIIFKDDKSIVQFPDIEGVDYFPAKFNAMIWDIWLSTITKGILGKNKLLKKTVKILCKTDLIIYSPGGSVINDRFFWRKQMEYLVPFIYSKLYKIPLFIASPSIGPFDSLKPNRIRKWLLKTPKIFCVRDEISYQYLKEIGIRDNVEVTIDSAFLSDINKISNEEKFNKYKALKDFLDSFKKVVGITLTDFKWHVKLNKDKTLGKKIEDTFCRFIKKLDDDGFGVVFIPQLFGNQDDYNYMKQYSRRNTFIMDDTLDNYFQQYVISKLYVVIGMRYHSNIFAAKMGTPFLAVVYEEKMEGFLKLADLIKYSIPLVDISYDKLNERFLVLENDYDIIKQNLKERISCWKKKAERTVELLATMNEGL